MVDESPPSSDLPQLKSKRGTAIAVLVGIAVVAIVGGVLIVRNVSRAEKDRETKAYQELVRCVFGTNAAAERPSLRYRRIELTALSIDPLKEKEEAWPMRCASYGHAYFEAIKDSGKLKKDAKDGAYYAELFAKVVKDPHPEDDVYEVVDHMWTELQKMQYPEMDPGDVKAPPEPSDPLSVDALAPSAIVSKARFVLGDAQTDRIPAGALNVVLDAKAHADRPTLCTFTAAQARCRKLAPTVAADERGLRLHGSAEDGATPLVFASPVGEGGIFRGDTGDEIAAFPSYGGLAKKDGAFAVVGYDRAKSKFSLLRGKPGAPIETTLFTLKGVTDDRQVALVHDQLVFSAEDSMFVQRLLPDGPTAMNAPVNVGPAAAIGSSPDPIRGCRTAESTSVQLRTFDGDMIAIDNGERWSAPRPLGGSGGVLSCRGREAILTRRTIYYEGSTMKGDVALERCNVDECTTKKVRLDDFFRDVREMVPVNSGHFLTGELDGKLLVVWRAGKKAGVRMRLAPIDQIAATPDAIIFDDHVRLGKIDANESSLFEMRLFTRPGFALLLLSTTAGVHAVAIDAAGKVKPFAVDSSG